jgi:predicted dehydrogenase
VAALFDPNPAGVAQLGAIFPDASRLDTLTALSGTDAELVIIASPPRYHAAQTIQALQAGLSVLCEKPMATTVAEGEAMVVAAKAARRVLAIGLVRRFFPATQTIRNVLSSGILGDILSFYCYEGGNFKWPAASPDFFKKHTAQGGVLLDIGVHALDLVLWWLGQPDEVVYEDDAMGGIEVNCRLHLHFPQGWRGEIRLSREWARPNYYLFQCTKGWLRWMVNEADKVQMGFTDNPYTLNAQLQVGDGSNGRLPKVAPNFQDSFIEQIRNVVAAVRGGEEVLVSGEEGLRSLRLIEQCYSHRTLMPMPWLSETERKRARLLGTRG